jgi:hypothetical protein
MSIRETLSKLSNNQLIAGLIVALLVMIGSPIGSYYVVKYIQSREIKPQVRSIETVTMKDLENSLAEAKTNIKATGYYIKSIDPDLISSKISDSTKFSAKIVMVDPLAPNKIICQRQRDEDDQPRNYQQILLKIREFRQKSENQFGERLKIGLIDVYPTMNVIIVDEDLYAYFYPYKAYGVASDLGPSSPILKFSNYTKDERAKFFSNHLDNIFNKATFLSPSVNYRRYEAADLKDPCY